MREKFVVICEKVFVKEERYGLRLPHPDGLVKEISHQPLNDPKWSQYAYDWVERHNQPYIKAGIEEPYFTKIIEGEATWITENLVKFVRV